MKKLYSFIVLLCLTIQGFAQQATTTTNNSGGNSNDVPSPQLMDVIGSSTFDVQTFASGGNRAYNKNGYKGAIWNSDMGLTPTIRTGYNFHDGNSWLPNPIIFVDTIKWPEIDFAISTEYIMGHNDNMSQVYLLKRTIPGPLNWTISNLPPEPGGHYCKNARMSVGGPNDSTIHVLTQSELVQDGGTLLNGIDGALTYSRSLDGGNTWDIIHQLLPDMNTTNYKSIPIETYAIDVKGSNVAIIQNSSYNDWKLWKSVDNGNTWTTTVINQFPWPAYDLSTQITDLDADAVADTVETFDGSNAVLIDNNGMVHCWSGMIRMKQDNPGGPLIFYPVYNGISYWNENYGSALPTTITSCLDLDNSATIDFAQSFANYNNIGACSMPSAGTDQTSKLFLVYSAIVENTSSGSVIDQNFRNLYCMVSPDNGLTWTFPYNISNSVFYEEVYPSLARDVDDKIHVLWQRDVEPGTTITDNDAIGPVEINFTSEDTTIFTGLPVFNPIFNKIEGRIYNDVNQNGVFDGNDFPLSGHKVLIMPGNTVLSTNLNGEYKYVTGPGNYTVTYSNQYYYITSGSTMHNVQLGLNPPGLFDFGVFPTTPIYSMGGHQNHGSSCNDTIKGFVTYYNNGNMITNGTVKYIKESSVSFFSSVPPNSGISGDTIFYNFSNLNPGTGNLIQLSLGTFNLQMGDTISSCMNVEYTLGIPVIRCNNKIITCAYDPNAKSVHPEGVGVQHNTLLTDTLLYSVYFQNTGTDTAFTVRIRDTLDMNVDISTFQVLSSTHSVQTTLKPDRSILFEFAGIMLPDSNVNMLASQGMVMYSVEPVASIIPGTVINNTAYIYFDFNPPIQTNTTFNTMVSALGITEKDLLYFNIFPNPTNGNAVINFENQDNEMYSYQVTDITGKEILTSGRFSESPVNIESGVLEAGMYFIRILSDKKVISTIKLVKSNH